MSVKILSGFSSKLRAKEVGHRSTKTRLFSGRKLSTAGFTTGSDTCSGTVIDDSPNLTVNTIMWLVKVHKSILIPPIFSAAGLLTVCMVESAAKFFEIFTRFIAIS